MKLDSVVMCLNRKVSFTKGALENLGVFTRTISKENADLIVFSSNGKLEMVSRSV